MLIEKSGLVLGFSKTLLHLTWVCGWSTPMGLCFCGSFMCFVSVSYLYCFGKGLCINKGSIRSQSYVWCLLMLSLKGGESV